MENDLVSWMKPQNDSMVIDVASGTGDLAKIISKKTNNKNKIYCIEPNKKYAFRRKRKIEII